MSAPFCRGVLHLNALLSAVFISLLPNSALADAPLARQEIPLEFQIDGGLEDNFRYLAAQCWLPKTENIRGILCVVLHPDGSNGRTIVRDREWRELAHAYDAALMAVSIVPSNDMTKTWFDASKGSGSGLLKAVSKIAQKSRRPDLETAPLLVVGVCAAGQFSYEFTAFRPDRTMGFVTIGGAKHRVEIAASAAKIPSLLIITPDRGIDATANLEALSTLGQLYRAPWHRGSGLISVYDSGGVDQMVTSFVRELLAKQASNRNLCWNRQVFPAEHGLELLAQRTTPSFLGKPLPIVASANSTQTPNGTQRISIRVRSNQKSAFDNLYVPEHIPCLTTTSRIAKDEWQIDLKVDSDHLPNGTFQFEVPVRFSKSGKSLLGGLQVPVSGTISGDIYSRPSTVRINWTDANRASTFELLSRNKLAVSGVEVERVVPDFVTARLVEAEGVRVIIAPREDATQLPKTFAGHLILRATSDTHQRIKVPFYGSITM